MSVQKAKNVFNDCQISEKVEPVLGDAVKAAGVGFLLASNCFKDLGAVLLIADEVIQDPSDVVNDVVILIFVALLGRQSMPIVNNLSTSFFDFASTFDYFTRYVVFLIQRKKRG